MICDTQPGLPIALQSVNSAFESRFKAPLMQWKTPSSITGFLSLRRAQEILYLDCNDRIFVGHRVGNAGRVGIAGKHGLFIHILHRDCQHGHVLSKQAWKKTQVNHLGHQLFTFHFRLYKLKRATTPVWMANTKHVSIAPLKGQKLPERWTSAAEETFSFA